MSPAIIIGLVSTAIQEALTVYGRWQELKAKRASGKPMTPEDIDALFAPFEGKTYDDYIEEERKRQSS